MDEEKYTWDDIIIDPTSERAKEAIGRLVYYADVPLNCINYANVGLISFLGVLDETNQKCYPFHIKGDTWACIIVKKEPSYKERAKQWIEENGLKEGDYVKVTRKAKDYEDGWGSVWNNSMTKSVCKTLKVKEILLPNEYVILENGYSYPYFVLEKTEESPKPKYVPFSNYEDFMDAYISCLERNKEDTGREAFLANHGIWLYNKFSGELACVINICDNGVVLSGRELFVDDNGYASYETVEWETLLDLCEFLDCSPCGKLIEET